MRKKKIDELDIAILNILSEHAELYNRELSGRIGLSPPATLVRSQNLWKRGVIAAMRAQINLEVFGYTYYHLVRIEVVSSRSEGLKARLLENRYLVMLIEIDASLDISMRLYLAVFVSKHTAGNGCEFEDIINGEGGIVSITRVQVSSITCRSLKLDTDDLVR